MRPGGTEPKIKRYILLKEAADDLDRAREAAAGKVETIIPDLVARVE